MSNAGRKKGSLKNTQPWVKLHAKDSGSKKAPKEWLNISRLQREFGPEKGFAYYFAIKCEFPDSEFGAIDLSQENSIINIADKYWLDPKTLQDVITFAVSRGIYKLSNDKKLTYDLHDEDSESLYKKRKIDREYKENEINRNEKKEKINNREGNNSKNNLSTSNNNNSTSNNNYSNTSSLSNESKENISSFQSDILKKQSSSNDDDCKKREGGDDPPWSSSFLKIVTEEKSSNLSNDSVRPDLALPDDLREFAKLYLGLKMLLYDFKPETTEFNYRRGILKTWRSDKQQAWDAIYECEEMLDQLENFDEETMQNKQIENEKMNKHLEFKKNSELTKKNRHEISLLSEQDKESLNQYARETFPNMPEFALKGATVGIYSDWKKQKQNVEVKS